MTQTKGLDITSRSENGTRNPLVAKLDRLFRIDPVKVKAKDGSGDVVVVEHRIGKDGGSFTINALMDKLGLEREYLDIISDLEKKFRDREKFKEISDRIYTGQKAKCNNAVRSYRKFLEQFYENQLRPLFPMFSFVPVSDKADALYIQGLLDCETLKLVVGDVTDDASWAETTFTKTKRWADLNAKARRTAKALIALPGVNKDLAERLHLIAKGEMPARLTWDQK